MVAMDIYDVASKINDALGTMGESEVKKAILMALVARGMEDILVEPGKLGVSKVPQVFDSECLFENV